MTKPLTVEQLRCFELSTIIREGLEGVRFDMLSWTNKCGTAGCMAGYAIAKYRPDLWGKEWVSRQAAELLGIEGDGYKLFCPWEYGGPRGDHITPAMAANTLERFARTGEVVWK